MFFGPWSKWSFFESIVGGAILAVGTWYLHRGFLLANFPQIAADLTPQGSGLFFRLTTLSLASIVAATTINHIFDAIIPLIIGDKKWVLKRHSTFKKLAVIVTRLFTFTPEPDPRIAAIRRYLSSSRRDWFVAMIRDWTKTDDIGSKPEDELVSVHQHIVARLKTNSLDSRSLLQQSYSDVVFAGSLFIAFLLLIPISLLSFLTQTEQRSIVFHVFIVLFFYVSTIVWGFLFRRRLRTFFSQVLTIGMHYYDAEQKRPASTRK